MTEQPDHDQARPAELTAGGAEHAEQAAAEPAVIEPTAILTREQILAAADLPVEDVPVPEWGGVVRVRGLSGQERDDYFARQAVRDKGGNVVGQNTENASSALLVRCIIGPDGKPAFTLRDIYALGEKSAAASGRVFEVAARLSGLTDEDIDALEKGSAPAPDGATTSS